MPNKPSEPTNKADEIRSDADAFDAFAPELRHGAIGEHDLHAQHVIAGHAVFQAVGAAAVEGDIAADGADGLARWIGRVV